MNLAGEVLRLVEEAGGQADFTLSLAPEQASARLAAGKILLNAWLPVDETAYYRLVGELLHLCQGHGLFSRPIEPLLAFLQTVHPEHWLEPSPELLSSLDRFGAPAGLILWISQKALAPFYQQACAPYAHCGQGPPWERGVCFCCGSPPVLARLAAGTGQRWLYCGLCTLEWPYTRQTCPFCQNLPNGPLPYVFQEDDPARRLYQCPGCGHYLKTIDESRLSHRLYLPLEEFVTLDLDLLAVSAA